MLYGVDTYVQAHYRYHKNAFFYISYRIQATTVITSIENE